VRMVTCGTSSINSLLDGPCRSTRAETTPKRSKHPTIDCVGPVPSTYSNFQEVGVQTFDLEGSAHVGQI
jgi:hypothetical protein